MAPSQGNIPEKLCFIDQTSKTPNDTTQYFTNKEFASRAKVNRKAKMTAPILYLPEWSVQ